MDDEEQERLRARQRQLRLGIQQCGVGLAVTFGFAAFFHFHFHESWLFAPLTLFFISFLVALLCGYVALRVVAAKLRRLQGR